MTTLTFTANPLGSYQGEKRPPVSPLVSPLEERTTQVARRAVDGNTPFTPLTSRDSELSTAPSVDVGARTPSPSEVPLLADVRVSWIHVKPREAYSTSPCALCEGENNRSKGQILINSTPFDIMQCKHDGHMWMHPTPDEDYVRELYSAEYFGDLATAQVGIPDRDPSEVERRQRISTMQVNEWADAGVINHDHEKNKGMRMIEIGGGAGYLSEAVQIAGLDVLNVDICKERADACNARGIPAYHGFLEEAVAAGAVGVNSLDVVACYDLLEHILKPNPFLKELHNVLKEGGALAIRVPNTSEEQGPQLHLVDHVNHFTEGSLRGILRKNGFEVFHQHYSGTFHGQGDKTIENMTVYARKLPKPDRVPPTLTRKGFQTPSPYDRGQSALLSSE